MTLTREEAIRIHRDMWRYLKEHGAGKGIIERGELKHDYCLARGYNFKYNCVLCEYADSYGGLFLYIMKIFGIMPGSHR